jgi:hypothetical protein
MGPAIRLLDQAGCMPPFRACAVTYDYGAGRGVVHEMVESLVEEYRRTCEQSWRHGLRAS